MFIFIYLFYTLFIYLEFLSFDYFGHLLAETCICICMFKKNREIKVRLYSYGKNKVEKVIKFIIMCIMYICNVFVGIKNSLDTSFHSGRDCTGP